MTSLYHHIKKIHGSDKWIQFRTHVIPGVHQHQCSKCHFAFDNEEKAKEDEHECDIFLQLYQNMIQNKTKRPQTKPETFSKPKENSKDKPKTTSQPCKTSETPEKNTEKGNEVRKDPEDDDSNEIMVIDLRQGFSRKIINEQYNSNIRTRIEDEKNPMISDNDDQNDPNESLPDDEPESQDNNGAQVAITSPPPTPNSKRKQNFLPVVVPPTPPPGQLFGNPNPKLPLTTSSLPVPVIQASLPSQTPPTFTPTFGYPQQQIIRPFSQPQQQNHYVQVPVGALVSVGTLVSTPHGQTIIPQPIQPIGSQTSGQMIYTQSTMNPTLQMSSAVSSSPSIRALSQSESEKISEKIAKKQVQTQVIQSSTPAKQPSSAIKEPISLEPSSSEMVVQNIEPDSNDQAPDSTQFESVLESIESIEIPDSPPPSQHNVVGEPVIERHPSTDQSHTGQMEIEGLDLNLAGNEEPSTQIDDPIPVSDSDDETSASGETLNNSNSSSNVTSGLKLEPIELGETPLAIVPIIESQSCLALEPPTQESHQVSASLPKSILKKTKRTSRHTIVEPSKVGFYI